MARKIQLEIIGDSRSIERAFGRATKAGSGFGNSMRKLAKSGAFLAAAGGALAIGLGVKAVKAASDLGEQINKTSVVFKKSAKLVQNFALTTASRLGISQEAALRYAGTFGNMLVPMGFARKEAAKMSRRLVQVAADMASFNNTSPEEALEALRAGLAGETEPLRRFGVFLADARLKQIALSKGIYGGEGPLDAITKAQASYAAILKDTHDAQGDFARTLGTSLPNAVRVIKAQVSDLAAAFGVGLLPVVQRAAQMLRKKLADPEVRAFIERLGYQVGTVLLNAFIGLGQWFNAHWDEISSGFRNFVAIMRTAFTVATKLKNALVTITTPLRIQFRLLIMIWDKLLGMVSSSAGLLSKLPFVGGKFKGIQEGVDAAREVMRDPLGKKAVARARKQGGVVREARGALRPRAAGGPVTAGGAYLVGERGPEMFVPSMNGTIVPNGGGGGDVVINLDGREIARVSLSHLQRLGKRGAGQSRGRLGGQNVALS